MNNEPIRCRIRRFRRLGRGERDCGASLATRSSWPTLRPEHYHWSHCPRTYPEHQTASRCELATYQLACSQSDSVKTFQFYSHQQTEFSIQSNWIRQFDKMDVDSQVTIIARLIFLYFLAMQPLLQPSRHWNFRSTLHSKQISQCRPEAQFWSSAWSVGGSNESGGQQLISWPMVICHSMW